MENEYLLLIDGSGLLSTQFFGNLPREILFAKTTEEKERYFHKIMMTSKGVYTNAVFGFLRTLFRILKDQQPAYLAVAWDLTRDTFRRDLYKDYKANRTETLEPLKDQFALCQDVLKKMNIVQFMDERYEADDFCGSLAKKFESEIPVRILTKDHDYLQLVTERTHMWLMHTTAEKTDEMYRKYHMDASKANVPDRVFELDPALVKAEFGVEPAQVNSLKGLQGDSSDNIKGVPGVGPATAVKLIAEYGSVDRLYQAIHETSADELKKYWKDSLGITRSPLNFLTKTSDTELVGEKSARLSELLATIKCDIDLGTLTLDDLKTKVDGNGTQQVLEELEFASLKADFLKKEEPQEDVTGRFILTDDVTALDAVTKRFLKEKLLGISYMKNAGLAIAGASGNASFIPEEYFITADVLSKIVRKICEGNKAVYSIEGKGIVKLADAETRDVSIGAYLLEPLKGSYPYEEIASLYAGCRLPSESALLGKVKPEEALFTLRDELKTMMCAQAYTAVSAGPVIDRKLRETGMLKLYEEIELPVMQVLAHMEETGIAVKKEALKQFGEELKAEIGRLETEIYALAGTSFNINSPKQLGEVLFDRLKIPYGKKTKSGYSTAADILDKLAPDYEIVRKVLDYRTYAKLNSTYAEGLQSFIAEDGRIYGTFNQTVTATGRLSSTSPNLQNIPVKLELGREIRKVFVPKEGCVFIDADYSQIELRVLAHLSDDENLINAYRDARDIHAQTASLVFGVPISEVTPLQRRNAKAVNFGIVYGISAFSLADDLSITRKEAQEYMDHYFETYPGIEKFLKKQVEDAKENGYVTTLYGRRRPIPELESANFNQRSFGERVAMNSPIQGTAADIMKIAMINVEKALKEAGLRSKIVLQIHDELLIEAYTEEADRVEEILVCEMEQAAALRVHLDADVKRGGSWYETK